MTRNQKANLGLVGIGAILTVTGLVGLGLAVFGVGTLVWPMLLFEPIVVGGGLITLFVGLGLQRQSVPMALATAAGCVAVAGFLSTVAGRNTLGSGILVPMLGLRLVISGVIGLWATVMVLGSDRIAWQRLVVGCVLLAFGGGIAAIAFIGPARPVRDFLLSMGGFVSSAVALVLFVLFVILVSAGLHLVVRPFEMAMEPTKSENQPTA
mgnify:CR=1 FL=1